MYILDVQNTFEVTYFFLSVTAFILFIDKFD